MGKSPCGIFFAEFLPNYRGFLMLKQLISYTYSQFVLTPFNRRTSGTP